MGSVGNKTVPRLDFSKFLKGGELDKAEFCQDLVDSLCNVGFVKLINHGIQDDELAHIFDMNAKFFGMPLDAKNKAAHPPEPNPHRGYSYVGQEKLSMVKDYEKGDRNHVAVHDIKESYDLGPVDDNMYPNRWPDESDLPGFRSAMESFYLHCNEVHLNLLRALEQGTNLGSGFLQNLCRDNTSELRLNHYPGCEAAQLRAGAKRISEHTDFGTVTLLFQDSVGGLEIEDQANTGRYFPIAFEGRSELIVNVGDCLARWTNDKFRSTSHRVVLPPVSTDWVDDRYSIAYFAKPNRTQSVATLPEFVKPGQKVLYDDISAWEYNQRKLLLTY
ncbi:hypothetical protein Golomagni_07229 [Golovinomyces magnicellulatus]|nr:hypothetical protein Golomagni_07229 [Golovinomyces magnicellulatus]